MVTHLEKINSFPSPRELLAAPKALLRRLGEVGLRATSATKEAYEVSQLGFSGRHALREDHPVLTPAKEILKAESVTSNLRAGRHYAETHQASVPHAVETLKWRNMTSKQRKLAMILENPEDTSILLTHTHLPAVRRPTHHETRRAA